MYSLHLFPLSFDQLERFIWWVLSKILPADNPDQPQEGPTDHDSHTHNHDKNNHHHNHTHSHPHSHSSSESEEEEEQPPPVYTQQQQRILLQQENERKKQEKQEQEEILLEIFDQTVSPQDQEHSRVQYIDKADMISSMEGQAIIPEQHSSPRQNKPTNNTNANDINNDNTPVGKAQEIEDYLKACASASPGKS